MKHVSILMLLGLSMVFAVACSSETETVEVIKEVEVVREVEVVKEIEVEKEVEVSKVEYIEVAPPEGPKREIVFGGLNWNSALIQNAVARYIIEEGYGHETSQIEGATVPLFQGLRKGDVDITMEIWLPNQKDAWNAGVKAGEVIPVGKSLEDNWQSTFLIPAYIQEEYPELDSIEDLKEEKYKAIFAEADSNGKAVLYGCMSGWGCRGTQTGNESGEGQIINMGLADHIEFRDPGTAGALAAAIQGAFTKEDPILFYYWGPTALMVELGYAEGKIVDLEQPDPSTCKDGDPVHGCAFPPAEIMIAMNTELINDAPYLIPFFQNWDWSAQNQLLAEDNYAEIVDDYGTAEEAFEATAISYLKDSDNWHSWVPDGVLTDTLAALAKE